MLLSPSIVSITVPPVPLPHGLTMPPLRERRMPEGRCVMRELPIPVSSEEAMKVLWRQHKQQFLERGYAVRHHNDQWILQQWLSWPPQGGYRLTRIGQEKLDALVAPRGLALEDVETELVLPPLAGGVEPKLRGYQVQPARQLFRALSNGKAEWGYPGGVDFSDMGVGKTYMDLAAALACGRRPAVLCPSVGQDGWRRAFAHFGAEPYFISTYEAVRGAFRPNIATMDGHGIFTWKNASDIILILDEAQALRHDATLTVRCCSAAIRQGIPVIVASATVALSPLEMRYAGRITGLHNGETDWTRFLLAHGCTRKTTGGEWKWNRDLRHLQGIHRRLFPKRGCRVRKQDLGEECPETTITVLPFELEEGREIEQEWKETLESLERLAGQESADRLKMLENKARMKVWQRCEMALVPHVAKQVREDVIAGKSVAVFMNFNASRLEMCRLLKTNAGFYGGQNIARRQHWEKEFQADREHILVNNIGAGGASVSLHDVRGERPRRAYLFPTDHVVHMVQATGRVDRVGGQSASEQFIVCVAGSMTEQMVHRTRKKMLQIATLNDGATPTARF